MNSNGNNPAKQEIDPAMQDQLDAYAREFSGALTRYFAKRGCQQATIDDLVQEVFMRLAKRAEGDAIENPEAYLMQTASSVWHSHLRYRQRRAHGDHIEFSEEIHAGEHFSPERVLEGREKVQQLVDALYELPARTRQVYVQCRIDGMKRKDAARRLGISVSAIEKHLMKASEFIGDLFGEEE